MKTFLHGDNMAYRIEMTDKDQYKHILEVKTYHDAMYYYERMCLSNPDLIKIVLIEKEKKYSQGRVRKINGVFGNE